MQSLTNFKTFVDDKKSIDDKISMLERYIVAENKEEFFNTLVYNSDTYMYMRLNDQLINKKSVNDVIPGDRAQYFKHVADSLKLEILFKLLAEEISTEKDKQRLHKLIDRFNKEFLNLNFDQYKITDAKVKKNEVLVTGSKVKYNSALSQAEQKSLTQESELKDIFKVPPCDHQNDYDNSIKEIKPHAKQFLDFDKFIRSPQEFYRTMTEVPHFFNIPKYLSKLIEAYKNKPFVVDIYEKLTVKDLEALLDASEDFKKDNLLLATLLKKKFEVLDDENPLEPAKKLEYIEQMLNWSEKNAPVFVDFILRKAVNLCYDHGIERPNLIERVIKNPINSTECYNEKYLNKIRSKNEKSQNRNKNTDSLNFTQLNNITGRTDSQIVKEYVTRQLKTKKISDFEEMFSKHWIEQLWYKDRLSRGEKFNNVNEIFTEIELNTFRDKRELCILQNSSPQFKHGEQVKLTLKIKNIHSLQVSVYEIDTKNYFSNRNVFDPMIDISGIIPSSTFRKEYTNSPILSFEEEFTFERITKTERGIFIVDFVGDSLTTRAVITKGWLNLIHEQCDEGHNFYILNEKNETCTGPEARLKIAYIDTELIADQTGKIFLPFSRKGAINEYAIIEYKGFCQSTTLQLPSTSIDFSYCLVFNEESMDCGKSTSFVIQPKLYANNRLLSLSVIKDLRVVISSINAHGLRQVKDVDGIKPQEGEDIVVEYMVPSKTTKIDIDVRVKIFDVESKTDIMFNKVRTISIENTVNQMYEMYLKQDAQGYRIQVLGRNGEPCPGQLIDIRFETTFIQSSSDSSKLAKKFLLETDVNGEVLLGKLSDVWSIKANLMYRPSSKWIEWEIRATDRITNLPPRFDIVEGEDLCLPALGITLTPGDYSLVRTNDKFGIIYEDSFKNIQKENDLLYLSNLKKGYYLFYYNKFKNLKRIFISVRQAKRWEVSPLYVMENTKVTRILDQSNYLTYSDLQVKNDSIDLKVICNDSSSVRVHALAYNYFPLGAQKMAKEIRDNCAVQERDTYNLAQNYNAYLSEKELSDEMKYVIERKNRSTFIGNTLEKPSGLLKRQFTRKCQVDNQGVTQENNYTTVNYFDNLKVERKVTSAAYSRTPPNNNLTFEPSYPFLATKDQISANAQADADGHVSIDISKFKNSCSTVILIIEDRKNCLCEIVNIGSGQTALKDIRLENSRDPNKVYLHERIAHKLSKGEKLDIPDLRTTDMKIINNRGQFLDILKLLTNQPVLDEWDFLKNWEALSEAEKLKLYDKYISHELNLFTYFKDREFFDFVVKAHIINKNEKNLIDHFLLDHKSELVKYLDPVQAEKTNIFEQALVILALKDTHRDQCEKLSKYHQAYIDAIDELVQMSNLNFDLVLYSQQSTQGEEQKKSSGKTMGTTFQTGGTTSSSLRSKINPNELTQLESRLLSVSTTRKQRQTKQTMIKENRGGKQTYKAFGTTDEYIERQYFFNDVQCCQFKLWVEFINHILHNTGKPFLSDSFLLSCTNFETIAIVSVIDLPSQQIEHESITDNRKFTLTATNNVMVFCKEIKERQEDKLELDIIINQNFFDNEQLRQANNNYSKVSKIKEFAIGTIYTSRVAITNLSDAQHEVVLVSEIPQGSVPMNGPDYLMSTVMSLGPLATKIHEFHFYFPSPGEFSCYPAAVTKNGHLIASSQISRTLIVHKELPKKELVTMKDILTSGNSTDILNFMRTQNILKSDIFKFRDIYGLLFDQNFYVSVCEILEEKCIFEPTVYSFSVYHADVPRLRKYLSYKFEDSRVTIRDLDIYYMNTGILNFEDYTFKEYFPLMNPRVHDIGEYKHNITNRDFLNTYITFLKYLLDKGNLTSREWLYLCLYFLLQDRVDDTLKIFARINKSNLEGKELVIQYDYLAAYLDLLVDPEFKKARQICGEYLTYPIYTWRNRFIEIANQIAECDGQVDVLGGTEEATKKKEIGKQVIFNPSIEEEQLKIKIQNVSDYTIRFYEVDPEITFSKDPSSTVNISALKSVKPILIRNEVTKSSNELETVVLNIPEELVNKNLVLILKTGEKNDIALTYYPKKMEVTIFEANGIVKVTDKKQQPLSKVYVKCFVQFSNGAKLFHRDGYTDLRGTFDYSGGLPDSLTSVCLLVSSPQTGASIHFVSPPRGKKIQEGTVLEVKGETWAQKINDLVTEDIAMESEAIPRKAEYKRNKYWHK